MSSFANSKVNVTNTIVQMIVKVSVKIVFWQSWTLTKKVSQTKSDKTQKWQWIVTLIRDNDTRKSIVIANRYFSSSSWKWHRCHFWASGSSRAEKVDWADTFLRLQTLYLMLQAKWSKMFQTSDEFIKIANF